eukprot:2501490-Amphidinium_carterae.1
MRLCVHVGVQPRPKCWLPSWTPAQGHCTATSPDRAPGLSLGYTTGGVNARVCAPCVQWACIAAVAITVTAN